MCFFSAVICKMALNHHRKSGQFCSKKTLERSQNIAKAAQLKWSQYRQKHTVETVSHDHDYLECNEGSNVCDHVFDVHEEEVSSSTLPTNIIPIDKYRLVVELGHIVKQLKMGA